jgi:hypothetical protein
MVDEKVAFYNPPQQRVERVDGCYQPTLFLEILCRSFVKIVN